MKLKNLAELDAFVREFSQKISPETNSATVLALYGDLGSGKTTFTQSLARELGVTTKLVSPTFVLMKRYPLEGQVFSSLIHVDAYRIEDASELSKLHFEDTLRDPGNLVVIEWPERISELIPEHAQKIDFTFIDETTREINYA